MEGDIKVRQGERKVKLKELGLLEWDFSEKYKLFITKLREKSITSGTKILSYFFTETFQVHHLFLFVKIAEKLERGNKKALYKIIQIKLNNFHFCCYTVNTDQYECCIMEQIN
jgi:hypothetical protein